MEYKTRQLIKPDDLNASNSLFGGRLLSWIDEEAAIYAMCQLESKSIVTAHMSSVNFQSRAFLGDIVEIGTELIKIGRTSISIKCHARNMSSHKSILTIDEMVFVCLDENGVPTPHGVVQQN